MDRAVEPELMTDEDQAQAYAGADFAEAHQAYVRLFAELFPDAPAQAAALDLGCGPGDVTFRFARAFPGWTLDAVDGSPAMLAEARRVLVTQLDLAARVTLVEGRLPDAALPLDRYPVVLSTSLLHHLHDPQSLWETVRRHAAPAAYVFVVDLVRPKTEEEAGALVDKYALGEPDVLRRDFYNSLLAAFTPVEVRKQLAEADLTSLRVQAISDRHLAVWGRVPTPAPGG